MSTPVQFQRKLAFLIGINDYVQDPLQFCLNDATDLSRTLERIGFTVHTVSNLGIRAFDHHFYTFFKDVRSGDLVLFYFAGHAKSYNSENYLVLWDCEVPLTRIVESVEKKHCISIWIIDTARKSLRNQSENSKQKLLTPAALNKALIVYSNAQNKLTRESANGRNGFFVENLLYHITKPNIDIQEMFKYVSSDIRQQTQDQKALYLSKGFSETVFLATTKPLSRSDRTQDSHNSVANQSSVDPSTSVKPKQPSATNPNDNIRDQRGQAVDIKQHAEQSSSLSPRKPTNMKEPDSAAGVTGARHHSPGAYQGPLPKRSHSQQYLSEIFGVDHRTDGRVVDLLEYLRTELPVMNKNGPMNGPCIAETDQMENFLNRNFGFQNLEGRYIVSGVRAFTLARPVNKLDSRTTIYFPDQSYLNCFQMTVAEILNWQNSYVVYADKTIEGIDKEFLIQALQGRSQDGDEAFRMKFVVRVSDCPILMKFDAKVLHRSLNDDWPKFIKLVSVTGIDFAGRKHDVKDVTTYIKNWKQVFELDPRTGKPAVFNGRDFYPVRSHPPAQLDIDLLIDHLRKMVRTRLIACDMEGVQVVVETGIGLGVFAGRHLGIDSEIRKLSAFAVREVLQNEGATFKNIRAVVFALPIFAKSRDGRQLPDTYDDFVNEFQRSNYSGPIPVLIADQDMHEITVAIARQRIRVSELNPADSHGVFGEYWQNHGPAVEEKLALTTVGLLVQHHLINPCVLYADRYKII